MAERGTQRPVDLATALDVSPSTATRMCDRLVAKNLVVRDRLGADRREVRVGLSRSGRQLVDEVMRRRRAKLAVLLAELPVGKQEAVADVLRAFAEVAGEVPERDAECLRREPAQDDLQGEEDPGDRGVEGGRDSTRRATRHR